MTARKVSIVKVNGRNWGKDLGTAIIGSDIRLFSETTSTNTLALEMARQGAPEGAVVCAATQTAGRGRLGRQWISPKGNLYLSVLLRPDIPVVKAPLITLMGAVATAAAIRRTCGVACGIKWPNDILISGRKVCGLLTEMSAGPDRLRHLVLGIGIDVNMDGGELPPGIRTGTMTLAEAAGAKIDRALLLRHLLQDLDGWYQRFLKHDADILEAWRENNVTIGNRVAVSGQGEALEGEAQGIDDAGRLIIRRDDGALRIVSAGDVTVVKG